MAGIFDFAPASQVPKTKPRAPTDGMSLNGWFFSSRPKVPYQRTFTVKLHGMRWYLDEGDMYDPVTDPQHNARRLELFYEQNETWDAFDWTHPHLGLLKVRFREPVEIPEAEYNSGGFVKAFDVKLIEHNPRFT